jgi:hypothetical protein
VKFKRLSAFALLLGLLVLPLPATAAQIIFFDDFDSENGGVPVLNYAGFSQWAVSDGTVDLIGNGYFDFLPGHGLYVDMDGSTHNAGIMTSDSFTFIDGALYTLTFDLAGSHRGTADSVVVMVTVGGLVNQVITLSSADGFTPYTITFIGSSAYGPGALSFAGVGGDNVGLLLDDVMLTVPDGGATLTLLGCALLGLGVVRRRFLR